MSNLVQRRRTSAATSAVSSPVALQFATPSPDFKRPRSILFANGSSSSIPHQILFIGGIFLAVLPWLSHVNMAYTGTVLQRTIDQAMTEYQTLQQTFAGRTKTLQKLMRDTDQIKVSNDELLHQLKMAGDTFEDFESEAYRDAEELENDLLQRIDDVEKEISRASERNLKERNYLFQRNTVEIKIRGMGGIDKHLVMELASTTMVPHVVDTFISLVETNYYNGWSIIERGLLGENTLQAVKRDVEQPQGLTVISSSNSDMHNQLALLQHSADELPNEKYAVVFKDHGPYFYINMGGGAHNHNDVVIGSIVQGREILDFMVQHHFFVAIESMVLRSVNPNADRQQQGTARRNTKSSDEPLGNDSSGITI